MIDSLLKLLHLLSSSCANSQILYSRPRSSSHHPTHWCSLYIAFLPLYILYILIEEIVRVHDNYLSDFSIPNVRTIEKIFR